MDDFFLQEPADMKKLDSEMKMIENNRISSINVPFKNAEVVLMKHPASLTLYKYQLVTALSGTVSVNGYEITSKIAVNIFSSEKTGLIEIKTESFEGIWKKKSVAKRLEQKLLSLCQSDDFCKRVLQQFENSTVAVLIERCALPPNLEFAEFYCPEAFEFNLIKKLKNRECRWLRDTESLNGASLLQFGEQEEKLASGIAALIRNAEYLKCESPRIIVCGPRNTGKSTLLQYLLNKLLLQEHIPYYLDTDPGQPEFTPPGVVSLTKIEEPILGPPFVHLKRKTKMIFTGDASPSFIDMYSKGISTLVELYYNEYADNPLFVNTMGWIEGTGLQCLINTIAIVKPTVMIEIVPQGETSMFDYREYLPADSRYIQICSKHKRERKNALTAKMMRELSLISYMGYCQPPYDGISPINELRPYYVPWEKISMFVFPGGNIFPSRIVEALNESIVALCHVPETSILESGIPEFPKTLEFDPENECLAYGLVQAVDETDQLLYVISPLRKHEWKRVNAIIKGNIMVPDSFILNQEIYNMPLLYADVQEESETDEEVTDLSMLSLQYLSQIKNEDNTSKSEQKKTFENFRKPIAPRYKRKSSKKL